MPTICPGCATSSSRIHSRRIGTGRGIENNIGTEISDPQTRTGFSREKAQETSGSCSSVVWAVSAHPAESARLHSHPLLIPPRKEGLGILAWLSRFSSGSLLDPASLSLCSLLMRRFPFSWLALVLLGSMVPGGLAGADWPQWRGSNRNGFAAAGESLATLPLEAKRVWKVSVGEGLASPVVADGRVFHFDSRDGKETVHALDAATARELWSAAVDDSFHDEQGPAGPRCTPLVDGNRLYVQSCQGELQCRGASDGMLLWRANFLKDFGAVILGEDSKVPGAAEHGYTASPIVVSDQLIACAGGTNGAGVVSFDKQSGKVLWKSQNDLASYSSSIVASLAGVPQLIAFTVEGVIGLNLQNGRLLWRVPLKTAYGRNVTTPVRVQNWVIVGSYQAGLVGIRVTHEGEDWRAEQGWANKEAAMNFSSPVVVGEHLYGLGPARNLICVDAGSGKIVWSKLGYWGTSADAAYGAFIVVGKNILATTDEGQAILFAADPTGCRELGRAQVCARNWCHPAFADGKLYIRSGLHTQGALFCLDLVTH